jgi:glucosamine--fructose-6-phosphate aminotransferase (isomerizing)
VCGIVGYIGEQQAAPILMEGLHRLEYRGYDSAGIALANRGELKVFKSKGKVRDLELPLTEQPKGTPGIAHTRWATHGEPSDRNAHPHCDAHNRYAIVHNGIVENASALRAQLEAKGVVFRSETDSEVIAHLIAAMQADSLADAVRATLRLIVGTYGLAVIDAQRPDSIVVARNGSPVILGIGSDVPGDLGEPGPRLRARAPRSRAARHLD